MMLIFLLIWVGASLAFVLALLGAAARPVPRTDEQVALAPEPAPVPMSGVVAERVKTQPPPAEAALASPCQVA